MAKIAGAALIALVLAAPAAGAPGVREASETALAVQVLRRVDDDTRCVRAPCAVPAPGVRVTILHDGVVVARRTTDRAGRFRIVLAPGAYVLRAPNLFSLPKRGERRVVVREGVTTRVTLLLVPGGQGKGGGEPQ